jgi:hypothetical protein
VPWTVKIRVANAVLDNIVETPSMVASMSSFIGGLLSSGLFHFVEGSILSAPT